jgi:hypothetical protein
MLLIVTTGSFEPCLRGAIVGILQATDEFGFKLFELFDRQTIGFKHQTNAKE